MKFPKEINAYCKYCKSHQVHKVKLASKGRARSMAIGARSHERSLYGHGSKRAGKKTVKKQGKKQKVLITCTKCNKRADRTVCGRTTKKLEFKA